MKSDVVNNLNAGQDAQNDGDVIHLGDTEPVPKENYAGHILHNVKHDTLEGTPVLKQGKVTDSLEEEHYTPKEESSQPKQEATDHENPQNTKKTDPEFSIDRIKHSDGLMKLYTGCPNYGTFLFILNKNRTQSWKATFPQG